MLPSLSDIAGKAKRRKVSLSAFRAEYESVTSLDILSILAEESLTQHQKEWLLISKFGISCVISVCQILKTIPSSLTDSQKATLLVNLCGPDETDRRQVAELIERYCPHLLESAEHYGVPIILAHPTGKCYERLVSNHQTQV